MKTKKLLNLFLALTLVLSAFTVPMTASAKVQDKLLWEFDATNAPVGTNQWWVTGPISCWGTARNYIKDQYPDGTSNNVVYSNNDQGNGVVTLNLGDLGVTNTGRYKIVFDAWSNSGYQVYTDGGRLKTTDVTSYGAFVYNYDSGVHSIAYGGWFSALSAGWRTNEIIIDLDTGYCKTTLSQGSTVHSAEHTYTLHDGNIATINLSANGGKPVYYDNFKIYKCDVAYPELADTNVTLKTADGTAQNKNAASPKTKTIELDFTVPMNTETLTSSNITLKDGAENNIPYAGSFSGNVYTMTLSSPLDENTAYTIGVSKDVAATSGEKLDANKAITFTTGTNETVITGDFKTYFADFEDASQLTDNNDPWKTWSQTNVVIDPANSNNHVAKANANNTLVFNTENIGIGNSGRYKISYKFKPEDYSKIGEWMAPSLYCDDGNSEFCDVSFIRVGSNTMNLLGVGLDGITQDSDWFEAEIIVDLDTAYTKVDVTKGSESWTREWTYTNTDKKLGKLSFYSMGVPAYYDDFKVEKVLEGTLSPLSANNISFIAPSGDAQTVWTDIDPLTTAVAINFAAPMNTATMTRANVYVTDASGNIVPGGSTYNASTFVYTLTFDNALVPGAAYTLHIDADVADISGNTLGQDYEPQFVIGAKRVVAQIKSVTIGGTEVTAKSGLTAEAEAKINLQYANSTGIAQTFYAIVAYYTANETLSKVDIVEVSEDASITSKTEAIDYTVDSAVSDAARVDIMVWDNFNDMHPISGLKSFN